MSGRNVDVLFCESELNALGDGAPTIDDVWLALEILLREGLNLISPNDKKVLRQARMLDGLRARLSELDPDNSAPSSNEGTKLPLPATATLVTHSDTGERVEHTILADPLIDVDIDPSDSSAR